MWKNNKMKFLLKLLFNALAILLTAYFIPGIIVLNFFAALVMAVILSLVNILIKPIVSFLTKPLKILTLGLFALVINALMLLLASYFVNGVYINSFASAFWGALIISIVSFITDKILKKKKKKKE